MAELPFEIITEILLRLPATTLLRFLSVCKSWYSLIKSPKFIKLHLNQTLISATNRHLFISYSSLSTAPLRRQFHFSQIPCHPFSKTDPSNIILWGSCNGVVCISDEHKNNVVLYNPTTKTHRFLPQTKTPYPSSFSIFGFGYDSGSDDYKVLRMRQCVAPNDEVLTDARVYSLNKNQWKRLKNISYFLIFFDNQTAVVNEALHYVVSEVAFARDIKKIARFDLRTECFSIMECPDYSKELDSMMFYLQNVDGCLSLSVNYDFHGRAELWVMKEYGKKESWMRAVSVSNHRGGMGSLIDFRAVGCSDDGEKFLVLVDGFELRWYDMRRQVALRAGIEGLPKDNYDSAIYVESLVLLDGDKVEEKGGKAKKVDDDGSKVQGKGEKAKKVDDDGSKVQWKGEKVKKVDDDKVESKGGATRKVGGDKVVSKGVMRMTRKVDGDKVEKNGASTRRKNKKLNISIFLTPVTNLCMFIFIVCIS